MASNDREKILEQISSRAESFGRTRGADDKSFSDWLQAAGEVMPQRSETSMEEPVRRPVLPMMTKKSGPLSNPSALLGLVLVVSGLVTFLLISYFAYQSLDARMMALQVQNDQITAQLAKLETQNQGSAKRLGDLELNYVTASQSGVGVRVVPPAHNPELIQLKATLESHAQRLADLQARLSQTPAGTAEQPVAIAAKPVEPSRSLVPGPARLAGPAVTPVNVVATPAPAPVVDVNLPASSQGELQLVQSDIRSFLASRDVRHYTLQMMRGSDLASMENFVKEHQLKGLVAILSTQDRGIPEYVMLLGDFAAMVQATQIAEQLKKQGVPVSPWMRSFGSIKNALN